MGKSTYARCGIIVNVTPLEPEWEGNVTLEFSNTTPLPAKIYAGEGCAQMIFFESDESCKESYKDKSGKYWDNKVLHYLNFSFDIITIPKFNLIVLVNFPFFTFFDHTS